MGIKEGFKESILTMLKQNKKLLKYEQIIKDTFENIKDYIKNIICLVEI